MNRLALLFPLIVAVGCSTGHLHQRVDPLYPSIIQYTDPLPLSDVRSEHNHDEAIAIIVERVLAENSSPRFDFRVVPHGRFSIGAGAEMRLTIDGKEISYSTGAGSLLPPGTQTRQRPTAIYDDILPDDLQAIAQAKVVDVEIAGIDDSLTGRFSADDQDVLRAFLAAPAPHH